MFWKLYNYYIYSLISNSSLLYFKVWNYKQKKCLFTLLGHLDYIRTTFFHHVSGFVFHLQVTLRNCSCTCMVVHLYFFEQLYILHHVFVETIAVSYSLGVSLDH